MNTSNKLAKLILILLDTNDETVYKATLESLIDRLMSCNKYLYMSMQAVEKCLFIVSSMIKYLRYSDQCNKSSNSYLIVQNIHNQVICDILDFVIRKANNSNEHAFLFENLFDFVEAVENLLEFENESNEFVKTIQTKLRHKILKFVLPSIVSCVTDNSQKNV